ncbi:MAG: DASS family sodium-coupled anion symporter [Gemmatimonadetes bacterium]|nr:DASS family sodium-coupled anion symporter [Gemmatimonadota bacterium]
MTEPRGAPGPERRANRPAFKWPEERRRSTPTAQPETPRGISWETWGQRIGVGIGVLAAGLILVAPGGAGLSPEARKAFAVFVLCTALWVTNAMPYGITALLAVASLGLSGALKPSEAYAAFGSSAIFFLIGIFLIGGALTETGLSKRMALLLLRRFEGSPFRFAMGLMLTGAFATMWMPNQATTAMLYPIAMEVSGALRLRPKESEYGKLIFFSMAWGAMVGGNLTFLGSSRAALALGMLQRNSGLGISFTQWLTASFPVVLLGLLTMPLILRYMLKPEAVEFESGRRVLERAVSELGPMRRPQYLSLAIILLTILAWVTVGGRRVDLAVIALFGAVSLFATQVLTWERAERHVYWNIVLMYGGAIALGVALERTGATRWLLDALFSDTLQHLSPYVAILGAGLLALLLSEVMSNAAALAVVLPLAFTVGADAGASPVAMVLATSFGAGLDFIFPMSTAPNTIIFASGYLRTSDFVRLGTAMTVASVAILALVIRFWWPVIGLISP